MLNRIIEDMKVISIEYVKNSVKYYKVQCQICKRYKIMCRNQLYQRYGVTHGSCIKNLSIVNKQLYEIYARLKQMCTNYNHAQYKKYGGIGVEFNYDNFLEFYDDLSKNYSEYKEKHGSCTITRIDGKGNFEKKNIKFMKKTPDIVHFKAISPEGEACYGSNYTNFAKIHNLSAPLICLCLKGKYKQTKGWKFERLKYDM